MAKPIPKALTVLEVHSIQLLLISQASEFASKVTPAFRLYRHSIFHFSAPPTPYAIPGAHEIHIQILNLIDTLHANKTNYVTTDPLYPLRAEIFRDALGGIHGRLRYCLEIGVLITPGGSTINIATGQHTPEDTPLPVAIQPGDIILTVVERDLCRIGKNVQAMRFIRERTGCGLREAKDATDRAVPPGLF